MVFVTRPPISSPPSPSKSAPAATAWRRLSTRAPTVTPIAFDRSFPALPTPMPTEVATPSQKSSGRQPSA
eukprot:1945601-Prymnesium_polylepis.1